ncbi:hypothetical protein [uncultured Arcticibacterium sp.]|uniref:hypothetical protein n=1 Tax=uncultured Arcticibacterium sp. TaxID=2173042 RepID=UPI0030F8429D
MRALSFFKVLITFFLLNISFSFDASAQRDVIITQANEEIRCRILDETPTRFVYAYVGPKGDILRNEIFKNLVRDFKYNKYDSDLPLATSKKGKSKKRKKSQDIALATNDVNSSDVPKEEKVKKQKPSDDKVPKEEPPKKELKNESVEKAATIEKVSKKETQEKPEKKSKKERKKNKEEKSKTKKKSTDIKEESEETQDVLATTKEPINQVEIVKKEDATELLVEEEPVVKEVEEKPTLNPKKTILDEKPLVESSQKAAPIVKEASVETTGEFKNYLKWRVGVKAGIGNILDNNFEASNAYGLYQEKLLKGWTFGADIAFFPLEGFGLGLVYTDFKSSNSNESLTYINQVSGEEVTGSISNKISRKFFGPSLFLRKGIDFKTFVVLGLSPGMYFYSDKGDYNQGNFEYTGNEFGGAATLGLDFLLGNDIIGRDIILSLEAGYNMGKINDLDYGDGNGPRSLDSPIIMDRLDFSIGLRFMRFPKYLKK